MRLPKRMRIWGVPVGHLWTAADVVAELPDPDATPVPPMSGERDADPDGPPVKRPDAVETERLDVPPEIRPWDAAEAPPRDPAPKPSGRPINVPHCNGRHGLRHDGVERCEWCDVVTEMASRLIALEREVADLRAERRAS